MRLPCISSSYEPRTELLRGIAISEIREDGSGDDASDAPKNPCWTYFPEAALPLDPALRVQTLFAMRDVWTLTEAIPYLQKVIVAGSPDDQGKGLDSMVADLFGRFANPIKQSGKDGTDLTTTRYVAKV